jgi:hypothetical protein
MTPEGERELLKRLEEINQRITMVQVIANAFMAVFLAICAGVVSYIVFKASLPGYELHFAWAITVVVFLLVGKFFSSIARLSGHDGPRPPSLTRLLIAMLIIGPLKGMIADLRAAWRGEGRRPW